MAALCRVAATPIPASGSREAFGLRVSLAPLSGAADRFCKFRRAKYQRDGGRFAFWEKARRADIL
jgi:hypothetical protein